jgi:ComF family protein
LNSLHRSGDAWRSWARRLSNDLIDVILPPVCSNCQKVGTLFCAECRAAVPWLEEPICMACCKPVAHPVLSCSSCQQQPLPLLQVRSATLFDGPVPQLLRGMKYHGFFALAQPLAELMAIAWPRWETALDLALPIPLHPRRERERGFNQSALLLAHLCRQFGWPTSPAALRRERATRPQVGLDAGERRTNLHHAFWADPNQVAGKRVLLVDDVCTTGATLTASALALLDAGAESVSAYCVARALGHQDVGFSF